MLHYFFILRAVPFKLWQMLGSPFHLKMVFWRDYWKEKKHLKP